MRIISAKLYILCIPFKNSFSHKLKSRDSSDSIIVELTSDTGKKGFGEVVPRPYVTGETVQSSVDHILNLMLPQVSQYEFDCTKTDSFAALREFCMMLAVEGNDKVIAFNAAKAGVELALIDLFLKHTEKSFSDIIPPLIDIVTYSAVITADSLEKVKKVAQECKHLGIKDVKMKVGFANDCERIALVRDILGDSISLRVDVNCAFNPQEAIDFISSIKQFNIASIEQPIARDNIDALAQVKNSSSIPVMVDESLITEADAVELIENKACDMFNLRIAKNGGIFQTIRLAELARQAGLGFQIGCQVGETAILSAAGRHLAAYLSDAKFVEGSYGTLLLEEDIAEHSIQFGQGGKAPLLNGVGLGINIRQDILEKYASQTIEKSLCRTGFYLPPISSQECDYEHPDDVQIKLLTQLLKKNQASQFGIKHHFSTINSIDDYRLNVPVMEYSDIESYINKIKSGEQNVLTIDPVVMFNLTSGTTGEPKYIPVTRKGQEYIGRHMHQWFSHALSDHPALLDEHFLVITGAAIEGYCKNGIPCGSASGMIYDTFPDAVKQKFAVATEIAEILNYELRYNILARCAYEKSVSLIATPSPLTLVKLGEAVINNEENIIRSIHNGWLSESLRSLEDCKAAGVPEKLFLSLKPNIERAAFLEKIFEQTGQLSPKDCWPDLKLIACWLGSSIGFHTSLLSKFFGETPLRDIGYMASEACINLPVTDELPGGVLALQSAYYEFIDEKELNSPDPKILTAGELKNGFCYKILLTNMNGLYRYDINDIISVDGFYHQTPIVSFLRKSGDILNIVGEKLHLNQCLNAIDKIQSEFNFNIHQFRVVADQNNLRHEFFFDIKSGLPGNIKHGELLSALDRYLCANNIEYESKRKSKRINLPLIHIMDSAWESDVKQEREIFGQRDTQYKWIQLSTTKFEIDYKHIKYTLMG